MISIGSVENGYWVERVPSHGIRVAVPLRSISEQLGHPPEVGAACARLEGVEIGGFFGDVVDAAKGAVSKTVNVAKKVAKPKVVKQLYKSVKAAAPTPYKEYLQAVETGVKFGKAMAGGNPKAKQAFPAVKQLAEGKITVKQAEKAAKKAGLKPNTVKRAAAALRLKQKAHQGDAPAKKALAAAAQIEGAGKGEGIERTVKGPSGRKYHVTVVRARAH